MSRPASVEDIHATARAMPHVTAYRPDTAKPSSSLSGTAVVEPAVQGPSAPAATEEIDPEALPADSGKGRRIVFSETEQRVWLVRKNDTVRRTYLVSGSTEDNLDPGRQNCVLATRFREVGIRRRAHSSVG